MFFETSDGTQLFYQTYGQQGHPPIVLLHGLGADHQMFSPQFEKYANQGFNVIVPDLRGHGKTSKVESLTLSDWTSDIKELLDHLGIERTILLGVSMGGVIIQKFVSQYPHRVEKMVISDSFGEIKSFPEKAVAKGTVIGFKIFKYLPKKWAAALVSSAYKDYNDISQEYFRDTTLKVDFEQIILARKAINQIDVLDDLQQVDIPALILVGDGAEIMIKTSKKIVDSLNNSSLQVIQGGFDPSNLVQPEQFDRAVLNFIK